MNSPVPLSDLLLNDARSIITRAQKNAVRSVEFHRVEMYWQLGERKLELSRQFYRCYPIANALCSQLNWFQYRLLIRITDADKR